MIKRKLNLFIVGLIGLQVVLAAVIYLDLQPKDARVTWRLEPETVSVVKVATQTQDYRFTREDGRWYTEQNGQRFAADQNRMSAVLSLLSAPQDSGYDAADVNLDTTGLAQPTATVHFDDVTVNFGYATDDQQQRYVAIAGRVYLINELVFPLLNTGPIAFRESQ